MLSWKVVKSIRLVEKLALLSSTCRKTAFHKLHCGSTRRWDITYKASAIFLGCGTGVYCLMKLQYGGTHSFIPTLRAKSLQNDVSGMRTELSRREIRFSEFASCEFNGQILMTPFDFIESLIENHPKLPRASKIRLTEKDIRRMTNHTPRVERGSSTFFRDLHQDGVITYSEYLFLVTVLTKSSAGLKIALKMMDVNGDQLITKEEFELVEKMISSSAAASMRPVKEESDSGLQHTTLLTHLFGGNGTHIVTFDDFFRFMDNFQSEVLELEFHEYSKSMKFISELDFAKILLRNTVLSEVEYSEYLNRLKNRIKETQGISLAQFKIFHNFLSNLEDFILAVNMINISHQPLDPDLFRRAVLVSTGEEIDRHVMDVVFQLFDKDGDGKLSQVEFIGIMKDRLKRGFGKYPNIRGFQGFMHCLKKEMTRPAD